jgi:hypothetical protein
LTDAHAAPNLGQIEKIDDAFDAVGLRLQRIKWVNDVLGAPAASCSKTPTAMWIGKSF